MAREYNLREEVLAVTQRWPIPFLVFILGCLLGWGVSYLFPAPYRAQELFSVAYNGDTIYRNPDDYKNWYMEQLSTLATASDVVQDSLNRLKQSDSYWEGVKVKQFTGMLGVSWRTVGVWRFMVDADRAKHAEQAIQVWGDVFIEKYHQAFKAAEEFVTLDKQLVVVNTSLTLLQMRSEDASTIQEGLKSWRAANIPSTGEVVLGDEARWQLWSMVAQVAGFDPAWKQLLDQFPNSEALPSQYAIWLDQVSISLRNEQATLPAQLTKLNAERQVIEQKYLAAAKESRGMSATLLVERASPGGSDSAPKAVALRPASQMALVGGIVALIAWSAVWLARKRRA